MRLAHAVTAIAALIGAVAIGFGAYGLYSLEFIEWAMKTGNAFDNPQYGNMSQGTWRAGYQYAMGIFIALGVIALVASYGLLRGKRWAQYVWLAFIPIQLFFMVSGFPRDLGSWAWVVASVAVFVFSLLVFRASRPPHAAP